MICNNLFYIRLFFFVVCTAYDLCNKGIFACSVFTFIDLVI